MRLGIFAKTFPRDSLDANLAAVRAAGLDRVQFNLSVVGLPTLPEGLEPALSQRVHQACAAQGVTISAISGTFNLIHPDRAARAEGLRRLGVLAQACSGLGTRIITLCSGTRDPADMWRWHPENASPAAWSELCESVPAALETTEPSGVLLAVEPELANVVDSAAKARRLLDEMQHPRLKIVIDPANLFPAGTLGRMPAVIDEAIALLAPDIVLAHAKDLAHDGAAGDVAAGRGRLDFGRYLQRLAAAGYQGDLILHGLSEAEVPASVAFLRELLSRPGH